MAKNEKTDKKPIFMLVDGHALMHKGFHAIPFLSTSKGEPTNATFGFTTILLTAIKDLQPNCLAVAFDLPKPTFRHEQYAEYKAHRKISPTELTVQVPRVKEVVKALNIPIYEQGGFEADDLIGTLARKIEKEYPEFEVVIVTGDLDTLQLVSENIKVYTMRKGLSDAQIYGPAEVRERYGLTPEQMVDYRALKGDPSDNIPGVSGIGEKTAVTLLQEYDSLDNLYKQVEAGNTEIIKPKVLENLQAQKEQAYMSKELSKIVTDIPVDITIDSCRLRNYDTQKVVQLFQELEFKQLVKRLPEAEGALATADEKLEKLKNGYDYHLVDNIDNLRELIEEIKKQKVITVDTETTSLNALECDLVGVSISWQEGKAYYVNVYEKPEMLKMLKEVLEDGSIGKYGHNLKYDYEALLCNGIRLYPMLFDTMIASYLLNPGSRQHDLATLVFNEFGYQMMPIADLIGKGKTQINMCEVEAERVCQYACEDADYTHRLVEILKPKLANEKLDHLFKELEMPLLPVLAKMEEFGVALNVDYLKTVSKEMKAELKKLEEKIHGYAGEKFNINSPSQLSVILFEVLELDSTDIKKTKTGISTAASELEKLQGQHKIIDDIFNYRELSKLVSTYVDALPKLVSKKDGRLHTSYNQTVAATGRLSSSDPNLQNIPIRTKEGQKIRKAFIAEKNFSLLSLDYSQIELRIVATLAKDKTMIEIFKNAGDIHTSTAAKLFGIDEKDVTPSQRRDAKTINFAVLYGLSAFGLSQRSDMSRAEAKEFIEKYFSTYPKVKEYIDQTIETTRQKQFVENSIGRKRYFPEILSSNFQVRSAAERAAVNMPIQSLNADIIKLAMIEIHKQFKNDKNVRMLLQVHDELVFEVREGEEERYAIELKNIMESVYTLDAGLVVDAKTGKNWDEMESIKTRNKKQETRNKE